jgi:outer membrane protein
VLAPGDAGLGFTLRYERPPYRGSEDRYDLLPLAVYDTKYFYLHSYRAGLKLERSSWRTEVFVQRRFEGFASDDVPMSMVGMARREFGTDVGLGASFALGEGAAYTELLRDVDGPSEGTEFLVGYRYERWWHGRLRLRPYATVSWRDAKLNDYYYGVRPEEATPDRPAYRAGSGFQTEIGLQAAYRLTSDWQVLAGLELSRVPSAVRSSPVVDRRIVPSASLGLMWRLDPPDLPAGTRRPFIMRLLRGGSSDCDLIPIMTLQCTTTHTQDPTDIWAIEVGERLVERLYGWPVDVAAFVGLLRHEERGLQPDFWQANAYLKAYFYGFPWDKAVRTRLGFGGGISYARRPPFTEVRDQALRNRDTSRLLLYADPTVDFSVGDLLRMRELRQTYVGLGASHRSGVFGTARLFGNVAGGSNYIYAYLETLF